MDAPCPIRYPSGMTEPTDRNAQSLQRIIDIMARLRDPVQGCPWDREQNFATIAPYTIEEAYEVAEAIRRDDRASLRDELGDLLLQVVFHSRMAEEEGSFAFADVADAISDKMIRRHPHIFGDGDAKTTDAVKGTWEEIKAAERAGKSDPANKPGLLDDIAIALPGLMRAEKLQKRAARVGFDWPEVSFVLDKIEEELGELRSAIAQKESKERIADELGDILFGYANVARHLGIDPEDALRRCNDKFTRRFGFIERELRKIGRDTTDASLEEMEALWQAAKTEERN